MNITELSAKMTKVHNKMCRQHRQYRGVIVDCDNCTGFTLKKVWNRGMGVLELWHIDIKCKSILINLALFNSTDKFYLKELMDSVSELKEYAVEGIFYGYPLYYNYGFLSTRLLGERKPFSLN